MATYVLVSGKNWALLAISSCWSEMDNSFHESSIESNNLKNKLLVGILYWSRAESQPKKFAKNTDYRYTYNIYLYYRTDD